MYKRILAVLLSILLLISAFSAAFTVMAENTVENENNTEQNPDNTPENDNEENDTEQQEPITITIGVINEPGTNKVGINIRADASTSSAQVYLVPDKTTVTVNGTKDDVNGTVNPTTNKVYVWYNVTYTLAGTDYVGYVREDLITVTTHTITPPPPEEEEEIVVKPFEEQLAEFPENYHPYLKELHEKYPNWIFTADEIPITYQDAIALESIFPRKLVENQYYSWRSMEDSYYNWNTGSYIVTDGRWYGASREVIAYYMDPRNFLNTNDAYIFMKQSYDSNSQSIVGLRELLKGRFLAEKYIDPNDLLYGGDFAYVIMEAAKQSGVNPYILASIIIQEQGTTGSKFAHGVEYVTANGQKVTVYNYFNFGVSGTTEADKLKNGAKHAYEMGWTTRSAAIIGGAKKYADGYVNAHPSNPYYNQDTYFYKNYNILNPSKIYHQYAQNVADQVTTASFLRKMYVENFTTYLTFRIPVYKDNTLPTIPAIAPLKTADMNNYYFNAIEVEGLTPSFSRYVYSYALLVEGDTKIYVNVPETAAIMNEMTFNLTQGDNKVVLTVKSATGYTNDYVINVNAIKDCVLTLTTEKPTPPPPPPEDDNPETITVGTITEPGGNLIGVNLRADADKSSQIFTKLNNGSSVIVNGSKKDINNDINPATQEIYVWYNVTYTNGTTTYTGYIREDMITVTTQPVTPPDGETPDPDNPGEGGETPDPDNPDNPGDNPEDITPPVPVIKKGDVNGDGQISLTDLAAVRIHILELSILTGDSFTAADCNGDGEITLSDLAAIRLHLLGLIVIE